jgi:ATP phosphoribosyltransferase
MTVKLALPTGDPRPYVNELLDRAGVPATGYEPGSRVLRSVVEGEGLTIRVFREKDIPIQVATGNYHLGICGEAWLAEVQVRFPLQRLVRIGSFPGPRTEVWLAAAPESGLTPGQVPGGASLTGARIASELPNLADLFAIRHRIPGYRLLPLAGSADAYPPEDVELVLMPVANREAVEAKGLVPLARIFDGGLALVANADALATKGLGGVLGRLAPLLTGAAAELSLPPAAPGITMRRAERNFDLVRLAVPDGHAQRHTPAALLEAGLRFDGYDENGYVRRPVSAIPGLEVKVVRPQDMPQMVALGAFDLAISGVDLLTDHQTRFPSSPVELAVDLGRNRYRIGPVVDQGFPADTTRDALAIWRTLGRPVRIASEFAGLAELFARQNHLPYSTIMPIGGASEGFVPEDADILIEGTETGSSIRANGLKMLDTFMESTNCAIWSTRPVTTRVDLLHDLVERLRASVGAAGVR